MSKLVFCTPVCFLQDLKDDIDAHREPFRQLKILSYKITDVCMQEDVAYIEVTVSELEARWKELLGLSSARRKDLDENYKLSQKFFKGAEELMKVLDEAEQGLKDEEPIGVDPAHLRAQLKKHKVCMSLLVSQVLKKHNENRGKGLMIPRLLPRSGSYSR